MASTRCPHRQLRRHAPARRRRGQTTRLAIGPYTLGRLPPTGNGSQLNPHKRVADGQAE